MRHLVTLCATVFVLLCFLGSGGHRGRVSAWPVASPEVMARNINEIPQWHCLRYFKHDIHLMRRCRNQRFPLMRRVAND